jgi:hypothetical protein
VVVVPPPNPAPKAPWPGISVLRLDAPPFTAVQREEAPVSEQSPAPSLRKVSSKRNAITDEHAWFAEHGLRLPVWGDDLGAAGALPESIPTQWEGRRLVLALAHSDHAILFYGENEARVAVVLDGQGAPVAAFDFSAYRYAPENIAADRLFVEQVPLWAEVDGGVLYISHAHRTYAKSSAGMNAYITALALEDGALLWRSAPRVSNSVNFVLRDGWILTGYGFTAEPDFVYVLDQRTGKTVSKTPVKTGPSYLLVDPGQDALLVRTYDTNDVFALQ